MRQPLVSFIVPVHNGERTIKRCIESILCQKIELEVVVVDDGSDDGTSSVLASFNNPRLKVVKTNNEGAASARNRGVLLAQGRYVAFVDSDDWLCGGAYCEIARLMASEDVDLYLVDSSKVFPDGSRQGLGNGYAAAFGQKRMTGSEIRRHAPRLLKMPAAPWDKLIRREFAGTHPFPEGRFVEDLDWAMRLFIDVQSARYLPVETYSYSQSNCSVSSQRGARFLADYLWFFDQWAEFEGDEVTNIMVRRFLTTQMFVFLGVFGQAERQVKNSLMRDVDRIFFQIEKEAIPFRREERAAFMLAKALGVRTTSKMLAMALSMRTNREQTRRGWRNDFTARS